MARLRSLLYSAIFYPMTALWVLAGIVGSLFGRRPTLAVVLSWADVHHWLAQHLLDIRTEVEGAIPAGPHLFAVKHQSMFETLEMVRITHVPVIVIKKELADVRLADPPLRHQSRRALRGAKGPARAGRRGEEGSRLRTIGDHLSRGHAGKGR